MKNHSIHIAMALFGLLIGSCQKEMPNQPKPNQQPVTRLWLSSTTLLNETSSRQHAYWYGEDPDGFVRGFLIATPESVAAASVSFPDTFTYTWTTRNDSIIGLPLAKQRSLFTIIARAVDNTFKQYPSLTEGASIRLSPKPYWDVNGNKVFDAADVDLSSMNGALDTKSAAQLLPIRNTPPKIFFSVNAVDSQIVQQPESTFTVATFSWYSSDVDGDNSVSSYRIALNDTAGTARWFVMNSTVKFITLIAPRTRTDSAVTEVAADVYTGTYPNMQFRGTVPGLKLNAKNILYLQARDVAGEYSTAATMPSNPLARQWYVKKPKSKMLVVSDFLTSSVAERDLALRRYSDALGTAMPATSYNNFDLMDVGYGLAADEKQNQILKQKFGALVPANMNPALIQTFKLFDVVLWVSDLYPSYQPAQIGLFNYVQTGGKVIFSTTFPVNVAFSDFKALVDFAPIDSVSTDAASSTTVHTNSDGRMPIGTRVLSLRSGFPQLAFDSVTSGSFHSFSWRRIYKRTDAQYLYQLDSSKFFSSPFRYLGRPEIGVMNNDRSFVLIAVPLHKLNGGGNLPLFFRRVIVDEFGLN
jgi:hypothetical protein